ncbi:MAG: RNA polymerase sigma factor [Saprospiraceae bacterium]
MVGFQLQGVTDKQILQGCLAGQRTAQEFLYNHYAPQMFGICLRYASDYHHAEDILQEGFVKVFNRLDQYRGTGSFEGWLKRIFINTAIEYYRKSIKHLKYQALSGINEVAFDHHIISELARQDLLKVIQKLPIGYRTVFNLYAIEGYSHKEIATLLEISEGTSKSQLARARKTLQALIKTFL